MAANWVAWHDAYADAGSSLSRRLVVVRRRIGEALDALDHLERLPVRVLSLCAGDGRDLLPELTARPGLAVRAVLVELDARLAGAAREGAAGLKGVEVRQADAGELTSCVDVLPVDLLLLCGIFGNVPTAHVRSTIDAVPAMLAPDGMVIWTRGWFRSEDLRPQVRQWFLDAGVDEIAFDGHPERFGVGVARAAATTPTQPPATGQLFGFVR